MAFRSLQLVCISGIVCLAQPAFEVASIKPSSPTPGPNDRTAWADHGKYTGTGMNLLGLLTTLYHLEPYQIVDGPRWLGVDRYDIVAKGDEHAGKEQVEQMMLTLLAERCKLASHRETRELPVYVLLVDKNGPKMKESSADAAYSFQIPGKGQWKISKISMRRLAQSLAREAGRTVADLTRLAGNYDVTLNWTPDQLVDGAPAPEASSSIFTAVRDQLGLKLESRRHPTEVLVIDHVEKPSEN